MERILASTKTFNTGQKEVFNKIVGEILCGVTAGNPNAPVQHPFNPRSSTSRAYFLDALGVTGKTFTIRATQALLKLRKHSFIAVATSALAAFLLENGRTAHSFFKIPIPCYADSVCNISMESKLANELRRASLITWDEIVMCQRHCLESVDRTLRVIMKDPNGPIWRKMSFVQWRFPPDSSSCTPCFHVLQVFSIISNCMKL